MNAHQILPDAPVVSIRACGLPERKTDRRGDYKWINT